MAEGSEDASDEKINLKGGAIKEDDHDLEAAVGRLVNAYPFWLCGPMDCSKEREL